MPLGTLDRTPPPFFKQGPSALSKLLVFSALAVLLMVADARFKVTQPLRALVTTVLYPAQWLVQQPVRLARSAGAYFEDLQTAQHRVDEALQRLALQSQRAAQVEQLSLENQRLRQLLGLREHVQVPALAAQVLYDAADPYSRRVIIDQGQVHGVAAGSPVLDEGGVAGQVTRVHPLVSEVTLVVDHDQAIPVMNVRTGARSVALGDGSAGRGGMELRFLASHADVKEGDQLVTSGVDGVYPPGLPVARVEQVERRADSAFARIRCSPMALTAATRHLLVLQPMARWQAERPAPPPAPPPGRKQGGQR